MQAQRSAPSRVLATQNVVIDRVFQGPDGIANGGYLAGRFGGPGPTRVVLRGPVPVERPVEAVRTDLGLTLVDGATTLMSASRCELTDPVERTMSSFDVDRLPGPADLDAHPFPSCFVCGPANAAGLRIVFKRTSGGVAANFTLPRTGSGQPAAHVSVAGALDCSSGWASYAPGEAGVLGTFDFAVLGSPTPGELLTVVAERGERDGRKRFARSSVFDSTGGLVGSASATWIDIPFPQSTAPTARLDG